MRLLEIKKLGNNLDDVKKEFQIRQSSSIKQNKHDLLEAINDSENFVNFLKNLEKPMSQSKIHDKKKSTLFPRVEKKK